VVSSPYHPPGFLRVSAPGHSPPPARGPGGGPPPHGAPGRVGTWADPDHLVLPASTLVSLAGPVADETGWRAGFDQMIEYATKKGWVDAAGGIRVHVEQRR
ncbi:hypothetical protein, partial [Cryptosporangium sp. NPDC048952]|uniref:hypothetical protein n=1 Tax=Cryptosporangium sp. NPDC048952 TaxID=3363961 RepID=UPI0037103FA4